MPPRKQSAKERPGDKEPTKPKIPSAKHRRGEAPEEGPSGQTRQLNFYQASGDDQDDTQGKGTDIGEMNDSEEIIV